MKRRLFNKHEFFSPIHKQDVLPIGKSLHRYMNIGDRRRIKFSKCG